jgi:hypothetical protein
MLAPLQEPRPAIDRSRFLIAAFLFIAVTATVAGARRFPATEVTAIKAGMPTTSSAICSLESPTSRSSGPRGPFAVDERKDVAVRVASDLTITADFYVCAAGRKAPLVIVLHARTIPTTIMVSRRGTWPPGG